MPQTLYHFGFDSSNPSASTLTPRVLATSEHIQVLWSSWCDLIYITTDVDNKRSITYTGTGLSPAQKQELTSPSSSLTQVLTDPQCDLRFFGNTMHDGVRGFVCGNKIERFTALDKEATLEQSYQSMDTWNLPSPVGGIVMCSNNAALVSLVADAGMGGSVTAVQHLRHLNNRCAASEFTECLANFVPIQLVVNATTATAISPSSKVYTCTADPRYPSALGRPHTGTSAFEPVPYLSETRIAKIASGGYITAAIGEDGELFLWGQSVPGTEAELGVLHRLDYDGDIAVGDTVIWGDTMQDEDVKCLKIVIDGNYAYASDVAVGFGHVLVAAQDETGKHTVFAAGCGAEGQLGFEGAAEFEKEFKEVVAFRGKRIVELAAAGWSSFAVTEDRASTDESAAMEARNVN